MNRALITAILSTLITLTGLSACTSDSNSMIPDQEENTEFLRCVDDDLTPRGVFDGPLYDAESNTITGEQADTYIAATTMFNYRTDVADRFFEMVDRVIEQALTSPGFVGYELAYSDTCKYGRTITVWESESAMIAFMLRDAHGEAMAQVRELGNDGRTISWEITPDELPISWNTAREMIAPTLP